jgi:hypothetical protein
MLLVVTKDVAIGGSVITLYSIDNGKTWISRPSDLSLFKKRRHLHKKMLQTVMKRVGDDFDSTPEAG